jgi:hypothetical protein
VRIADAEVALLGVTVEHSVLVLHTVQYMKASWLDETKLY